MGAPSSQSSASTTATDLPSDRWNDRRLTSIAVRALMFVIPVIASLIVTRAYVLLVGRPDGWPSQMMFWSGAFVVSIGSTIVVQRHTKRLLPLAVLFRMSLVFPDEAPSRFKLALRNGNPRKLEVELLTGQITDTNDAAQALLSLISLVGDHDRLTRGHSERVRAYSEMIGEKMGVTGSELEKLRWGALIHDVGKLTVPPEILNKPGRPDDDEWQIIRHHPTAAQAYLAPLEGWLGSWALAATEHHERYDGTGYPAGLAGDEISLAGRIVAVADAYDVMTSARSYKKALSPEIAREELMRNAGTQFDPAVVRAMMEVSLGKLRVVVGPLAWLSEVAWVLRVPETVSTAAVATAVSASAVVAPVAISETANPIVIERVVEETPTSTTTTTMAPTTTAALAPTVIQPATTAPPTTTTATPTTTTAAPTTTTPPTTTTTTAAPTTT
ncbi:MAG: HD-GYP domain-containing protein, partial [Actinomycetota bacterium]